MEVISSGHRGEVPRASVRGVTINGFLITVLVVAVPTFFALFAPRRTPLLARASFWLGIAINELPFYPMVWLAAATILAAFDGTLLSPGGLVALPLAVAATGGLLVILARGLAARQALADGLLRAGLDTASRRVLGARSAGQTVLSLVAPFALRARGVLRLKDVPYGEHGRRNLLDVYAPRTQQRPGPVFVYFHGGGYYSGRKSKEARLLLYRLARRGWVCISANYRLRPKAGFEEHLTDLGKVLSWVRSHAAEHGGDPARIVLAGSSAGAHMSSIAALDPPRQLRQAQSGPPARRVEAVVCLYGYYGHYYGLGPEHEPSSSPVDHVRADAPAFFVAHGDHDTYVPVSGAREFAEKLKAISRSTVVYAELPGAQHSFDLFRSPRFGSVVDAVEAFLEDGSSREGA
jgi:acetyl esterase/lipase